MTAAEFIALARSKIIILDGATGTELSKRGLPPGVCPELWVSEHPEAICAVQAAYRAAGSDVVYTPTFGGNRIKLAEFGLADRVFELNCQLARLSRQAVGADALVFGDLAPTGRFLQPVGDLSFEELVDIYKEQVAGLLAGGVDGFVVETMMDLGEARAALLAVRESCDLACVVTMTFEAGGRTLSGSDPVAALVALQALGAAGFGCNCSTGPADMAATVAKLKPYAQIPLIAKPNAGLPELLAGKTVFSMSDGEFAGFAALLTASGAGVLGGCCGTTPRHIEALAAAARELRPPEIAARITGVVGSARRCRVLAPGSPFAILGERINPTGKKALQAELRSGATGMVFQFAVEQSEAGAALLDVNMGLSGIDERAMMLKALDVVATASDLPLCIDSTKPEVVEAALRRYHGRALLNSISAERERLEKVLPIAAKYGAMLILLPLTDAGIPDTLPGRVAVVEKIFAEVQKYGYAKCDVCVDALIMTVSANPEAAALSLDLIAWCHEKFGVSTVCGLSNISFGLPARKLVNQAFLGLALGRGLNLAIANPMDPGLVELTLSADMLLGRDVRMATFLARFSGQDATPEPVAIDPAARVYRCVMKGDADGVVGACDAALAAGVPLATLLDDTLIRAIGEVGEKFDRKEYFLPQLIMSADTMRRAVAHLEPLLQDAAADRPDKGKIILATVKGDIHDIGKNIVAIMLANYGFKVIDLGKDVPADVILDTAVRENCRLIGLSALMTTTMGEMGKVIALARERGLTELKFMVGGAVVDANFAEAVGAAYSRDALAAVRLAERLCEEL